MPMDLEFEKYVIRLDRVLRLIAMSIEEEDSNRSTLERFRYHWVCSFHLLFFNLSIIGQLVWLVMGIINGESLLEITYLLPCVTLCMLGDMRICSLIYNIHHINDAIKRLKKIDGLRQYEEITEDNLNETWLRYLNNVYNLLFLLTAAGVSAFAIGPFVIMASYYYTSGEIKLFLPFILWYPFDQFQLRTWPFVYVHQLFEAWMAVFSVCGPDCFFFTCCTFIYIHFVYLQRYLEQIVKKDSWKIQPNVRLNAFKKEIVKLVDLHRELIRCVELLNVLYMVYVYSKPTLFNVVTSSVIICVAGFNLMAIKNYVLMAPFCAFLIFGTLQVFFYCYYGDYVIRSSTAVGDAIYNSRWYEAGAPERKYLLTVLVRSQKPCKFTAERFGDVNLRTFTRILSTSWSYFALLNQMYQD